ncbi:MAG: hypothetical protein HC813_00320 [Planctomycetes bacterium]|nr:hypothetical protein [Planctomycetota bacterium]
MPLQRVLQLRQDSLEHLEGLDVWEGRWQEEGARALARQVAESGTWCCPTLVVYRKFVSGDEARLLLAAPEMEFVPPRLRATWGSGGGTSACVTSRRSGSP